MIIELSELRRVVEYLENNNADIVTVSFRPSTLFPGEDQLNIESLYNGAGGNIEPFGVPDYNSDDYLPF